MRTHSLPLQSHTRDFKQQSLVKRKYFSITIFLILLHSFNQEDTLLILLNNFDQEDTHLILLHSFDQVDTHSCFTTLDWWISATNHIFNQTQIAIKCAITQHQTFTLNVLCIGCHDIGSDILENSCIIP